MQNAKLKMKMKICNLQFAIDQRGFTLVELLIAMAIASVVGMAGVAVFSSSNWAYKLNEDVAEAQQNARVSMERLSKDIRAAGFGLPDPPFSLSLGGTWTSPITVTTSGGTGNSDSITILGIGYEAGALVGESAGQNASTSTYICYKKTADTEEKLIGTDNMVRANRQYISLNGISFATLNTGSTATGECGGVSGSKRLPLSSPSTLDRQYKDDTPVFIIQAVTYSIQNDCTVSNPCWNLKSNDLTELRGSGNQVLAENIEDIQFAYGVDADGNGNMDSSTLSNDPTDDSSIVAVRATVVAKARNKDMRGSTFTRPAIEDHSASSSDNYRRRILTKILKVRNPRTGG